MTIRQTTRDFKPRTLAIEDEQADIKRKDKDPHHMERVVSMSF